MRQLRLVSDVSRQIALAVAVGIGAFVFACGLLLVFWFLILLMFVVVAHHVAETVIGVVALVVLAELVAVVGTNFKV